MRLGQQVSARACSPRERGWTGDIAAQHAQRLVFPARAGMDRWSSLGCRNQRLGYAQIAERVGVSKSTVGRICVQAGLAKLPSMQDSVPVRRYEKERPGELLHLDMKKLGRFDQPGHRVTGDRTRNTPRAG